MRLSSALRRALWGAGLVVAGVLIGVTVTALGPVNALDRGWMALMASARVDPLVNVALAFNWIGGGWRATYLVPGIVIVLLAVMRRPRGIVFFVAASLLSVVLVQVLKDLFARARPEDMIVTSDFGSFPSGHAANAATLAVAVMLLFRHTVVRFVGVAWIVLMALSRTYLGAHWLTDTIAGVAIGTGAALVMMGAFSRFLEGEDHGREPASV